MLKLEKPEVAHFNIGDHVNFHGISCTICVKYESLIQSPALITAYQDKVTQEDTIYKWIKSSEFTEKKAEADHQRDGLYTLILHHVHYNLTNPNPSFRDCALHVNNLLKSYEDVNHLDYDAQTAAITSIITRLRSTDYIAAVDALGLAPLVSDLEVQNNTFKTYAANAEKEQVDKPNITPKASRRETDVALRNITDRVMALIIMGGEESFVAFADEFNTHVNHYNTLLHEHYGRLHARTDISTAAVDTIEDQTFTGEPVIVIPNVNVTVTDKEGNTKTVKLVFSVDFTVNYKDNTAPGTATLIIRGIGKYVGERRVTFNIKRPVSG
jgi:hypothetical protein